jgi:acyl-CoA dehydrogenase
VRCHPFVLKEIAATQEAEPRAASAAFDEAFWGHAGFLLANTARSLWLGLTGGRLLAAPGAPEMRRYYRRLTRLSAGFALVSDIAMLVLGGNLKRKERLSARLGDILSQLYLASASLKRFEDDGRPREDLPLVHWALQDALHRIQDAFYGVFANFPNRFAAAAMRLMVFPWGRVFDPPGDHLGHQIAKLMMEPSQARERLTSNTFVPRSEDDPVGRLELAMEAAPAGDAVEAKLRAAARAQTVSGLTDEERLDAAVGKGILSRDEAAALRNFWKLRRLCIMVDDFPPEVGRAAALDEAAHGVQARKSA